MTTVEETSTEPAAPGYITTVETIPLWLRLSMFAGLGGLFIVGSVYLNHQSEKRMRRSYGFVDGLGGSRRRRKRR